jgi:hypothetical protein
MSKSGPINYTLAIRRMVLGFFSFLILRPEPTLHIGGLALTRAYAGIIDPLVRFYIGPRAFPNEETMDKFIRDSVADVYNTNYHFCMDMYNPVNTSK